MFRLPGSSLNYIGNSDACNALIAHTTRFLHDFCSQTKLSSSQCSIKVVLESLTCFLLAKNIVRIHICAFIGSQTAQYNSS